MAFATTAWWSHDTAATHPSLASSELPPLIPVRDFYADMRAEWAYHSSHDGRYLAWRATRKTKQVVLVKDRTTDREVMRLKDVDYYFWNPHTAALLIGRKGRLWQIDPAKPDEDNWRDVTPRGFSSWSIQNKPSDADDLVVIASQDRSPAFADLYTTDQQGGNKTLLIKNQGQTLGWVLAKDLSPMLRFDRIKGNKTQLLVNRDSGWQPLIDIAPSDTFYVLEVSPSAEFALAISARGRNTAALVRLDLTDGSEQVLHEQADEDLAEIINFDLYDGKIDMVIPQVGDVTPVGFTKAGKTLAKLIAKQGQHVSIDRLLWAGNGDFVTATLSVDAQSYSYHIFDLNLGTDTKISDFYFKTKHADALVPTETVQITARDGMKLNALLLRPKGVDGAAPMVLEVHGGPAGQVKWEYHHFRQFLVNRGYAVLAVNFRGSSGLGKIYQATGYGEYGRKMQDDLVDATLWAIDQGIADPKAIAINGSSYGGYASAMGLVRDPDLFKAGIIEHAMLDVAYQSQYPPHSWGLYLGQWERYFGDINSPGDMEKMHQRSPINLVAQMQAAALMVAGKRDPVVGFEQTERFITKAKDLGKNIDSLIFENEGHGIDKWQSKIRHARRVEDFLAEHLGGRSGNWDWIEPIAAYLDK